MTCDQVIDRLPAATVRHQLQLDARDLREPLGHDVLLVAHSRRGIAQSRSLPGQSHELGKRVDTERRMNREHDRLTRHLNDRDQILHRIDVRLEDMRRARHAIGYDQSRVAVRSAPGDSLDADVGVGAGSVFDNDLLAEGS